jgi:hypothetical protein
MAGRFRQESNPNPPGRNAPRTLILISVLQVTRL